MDIVGATAFSLMFYLNSAVGIIRKTTTSAPKE